MVILLLLFEKRPLKAGNRSRASLKGQHVRSVYVHVLQWESLRPLMLVDSQVCARC